MFLIIVALLSVAGALLWFFRSRLRRRSLPSGWLLLHEGKTFRLVPVIQDATGGVKVSETEVYPLGVATVFPVPGLRGRYLYVIAVEPLALVEHQVLERARRSIVIGSLFRPGGDLLRYLQIAALIVPLVVMIIFMAQIGGLSAALNTQAADLKVLIKQSEAFNAGPVAVPTRTPVAPAVQPTQVR